MSQLTHLLLLLFVFNLGITLGAGLYEMNVVLPQWFPKSGQSGRGVNKEAMRKLDSGRKFWAFASTIPLTILTLTNLVLAWQSQQSNRIWWLAAALIVLVERIGTFSFFIPTAIKLQKDLPASGVSRLVLMWLRLNYVRNGFTMLAFIAALLALCP